MTKQPEWDVPQTKRGRKRTWTFSYMTGIAIPILAPKRKTGKGRKC
jgi:hypothetical protein